MVNQATVTLYGRAKAKESIDTDSPNENITSSSGSSFSEMDVRYEATVEDPLYFHRLMCHRSAAKIAENCVPDMYKVEHKTYDDWDISVDLNATEVTEWAEGVAQERDESVYDVLTLWLQTLGDMRIRRALHSKLEEEGIDISEVT